MAFSGPPTDYAFVAKKRTIFLNHVEFHIKTQHFVSLCFAQLIRLNRIKISQARGMPVQGILS